jgi:hypothetical protein
MHIEEVRKFPRMSLLVVRDMSCLAHIDPATGKSTHTNLQCEWVSNLKSDPEAGYKHALKHRPRGKGGKGNAKTEEGTEDMDEDRATSEPKMVPEPTHPTPSGRKVPEHITLSSVLPLCGQRNLPSEL